MEISRLISNGYFHNGNDRLGVKYADTSRENIFLMLILALEKLYKTSPNESYLPKPSLAVQ